MDRFEYTTPTMGTILKFVVIAETQTTAERWIDVGLSEIERLIPIFNNYSPASEISRLNARSGTRTEISADLYRAIAHSRRWHELSNGVFDITCGALFELWRQARSNRRLPTQAERKDALERCGWNNVECPADQSSKDPEGGYWVTVNRRGLVLDLSGIATGYIIDSVADRMIQSGCTAFLIDIGGDIRLGGPPGGKEGWRVQVAGLQKSDPPIMELSLSNCSLTTSGDRNQSLVIDGVTYSHLLDPRTGDPLTNHQSCTAIASKAIDADAAATALSVLGRTSSSDRFDRLPIDQAILLYCDATSDPAQRSSIRFSRLLSEK
ncbi:MAG: FAD:protein FMN transferase [Planctomycetota bacterium]|nr:FAD:protein FMN transferase [Planctomycetota bacterium]